jgi:uncharacterized repeat protein (TIGR01451 family)
MKTTNRTWTDRLATVAALAFLMLARGAGAQAPAFDAVVWTPLACAAGDPAGDETPSAVDLVGDAAHLAAYTAHDGSYLYMRFRVNGDPTGSGGFHSYAWNVLMQVPSGDPFQYQYELSLNGKSDTVEVWANTSASDIDFSPLFNDPSDVQLFSTPAASLARHLAATDGSSFGGNPDYFVDVAFPVATLVAKGVVASAADLDTALFFPATATNANNYNKGYLACPFSPNAVLAMTKSVAPSTVPANAVTHIAYTIAVRNDGATNARGVVVEDPTLPSYLTNVGVSVSSDDPGATWTVVTQRPLLVRVPDLAIGKTVTVTIDADAAPGCNDNGFMNVATAFATNAPQVSGSALLIVNLAAGGCSPCASDADCDDANPCTADACGSGACSSTVDPACTPCATSADCADDGNACTTETCTAGVCTRTQDPACPACTLDADCNDGDACTTDACVAGLCSAMIVPGCTTCSSDADCADDGDACTVATCAAGACSAVLAPACSACATDADCNDGNPCTSDACVAGACTASPIAGCSSNPPEVCDNGQDDDGDGLVDCSDSDCADAVNCGGGDGGGIAEICGDCIDNDGNGLTDYEDPACCATPHALDLRRMMLRPNPTKPNAKRLRLKVRTTGFDPATLDPMHANTTLQLSDGHGTILCQPIPAAAWTHRNHRSFKFLDKAGTLAGGVKRARFKMKRNGGVAFRALGKAVTLGATDGRDVMITLGVGGQCSQTMAQLHTKRDRMVLP